MNVRAVKPVFRQFTRPSRLSRRARRVDLRVATNVTATLVVRGQRFTVGPAVKRVRVRIAAGRSPLVLKLRLVAGSKSARSSVTIRRG